MKVKFLRNWLGLYFLLFTSVLGAYILLLSQTPFLPISKSDGFSIFEIIIPVLVGQLTIIFKWFSLNDIENESIEIGLPKWVVVGPPLIVSALIIFSIILMIYGNTDRGSSLEVTAETFKGIVTFCVTILNATSIFIVSRFFKIEPKHS